jgi:hypothetical protein
MLTIWTTNPSSSILYIKQVWTQKCAVQKASVDVNISYYQLKKKKIDTGVLDFFFNIKLILDYYFCLMPGPVFLFQIFIIAPLPLPMDIKLYHL